MMLDTSQCAVDAYKAESAADFYQGKLRIDRPDEQTLPSTPLVEDVPQYAVACSCQQDVRLFQAPCV